MGKTSRAVIRGSRLFNIIFGLPRNGEKLRNRWVRSKAAPLHSPFQLVTLSPSPCPKRATPDQTISTGWSFLFTIILENMEFDRFSTNHCPGSPWHSSC
jgi:hypothetical protein